EFDIELEGLAKMIKDPSVFRVSVLAAAIAAALASTNAAAQTADAASNESDVDEEVVVTGFRASLQSATNAKRESIGFQDSVFAEDIGKFPDLNIAESVNRIPGVQLTREV